MVGGVESAATARTGIPPRPTRSTYPLITDFINTKSMAWHRSACRPEIGFTSLPLGRLSGERQLWHCAPAVPYSATLICDRSSLSLESTSTSTLKPAPLGASSILHLLL